MGPVVTVGTACFVVFKVQAWLWEVIFESFYIARGLPDATGFQIQAGKPSPREARRPLGWRKIGSQDP